MAYAVGIDLGTTNSCVAVVRNGQTEIIENEENKRTTPSFVYYSEDNIFFGEEAINRSALNPKNGIFDIKRLIGREFNDFHVQENIRKWPFQIVEGSRNEPLIELTHDGKKLLLRPEEVCAVLLKKLKEDGEKAIKKKIVNVVITVPAYFTNPQKQATIQAAHIAGLEVLKLINEPTAAALAFIDNTNQKKSNRNILVYDLGGGTFDVSLIKFDGDKGEVLTVGGDSYLGGRNFDDNLQRFCIEKINDLYKYKLTEQKRNIQRHAFRRLKINCEQIKIKLSAIKNAKLTMDEFYGHNVAIDITRDQFEQLNMDLFNRTIKIIEEVLNKVKMNKNEIDDIVLVGGSTRIPKIQEMVQNYFSGKPLNKSVNPDEAVAIGAVLEASKFMIKCPRRICTLADVTPFSIGIEIADSGDGRTMSVIIEKDTKIPARGVKTYRTLFDDQTDVDLYIFEGLSKRVKENTALGELKISGITSKKAGQVEIKVQLHVDTNGILNVTATENSQNITKHLEIILTNARLTQEEITKMKTTETFELY